MAETARRVDLILALGGDQLLMGQHERAVARFNEAIRIDPDCAEAYAWLGKAYREMGRLDEAERAFREAIRVRSDFALAHYNLGLVYIRQGHADRALRQYEQLRKLHPVRAERLLDQIQRQDSKTKSAKLQDTVPETQGEYGPPVWATSDRNTGPSKTERKPDFPSIETVPDFEQQAVPESVWDDLETIADSPRPPTEEIKPAETIAPNPLGAGPPPQPGPVGEPATEVERWRRAVASNPRDAEAHWRLGSALLEAGDYAQAAPAIEQAIANRVDFAGSHPDSVRRSVEMCLALGVCHERLGKFQDAIEVYEQTLDIDPDNAEACLRLGLVMVVMNNRRAAVECYRTLLRLDPGHAEPLLKRLLRVLAK